MDEIGTFVSNAFVDPLYYLLRLFSSARAFLAWGEFPLGFAELLFFGAEKAGDFYFLSSRERGETFQTNIYPHHSPSFEGRRGPLHCNREGDKPFSCRIAPNRRRFDLAL